MPTTTGELSGRPLLATETDAALFVDRAEELAALEGGVNRRFNVLLSGARGSGKTSTLRQLEHRLMRREQPHVFVEGGLAQDAAGVLDILRWRLGKPPMSSEVWRASLPAPVRESLDSRKSERLLELIQDLREESSGGRTIVLLDGLPSAEAAHTLFGRLRDELWQLPMSWVVAADESERSAYLRPPADAFFDLVVTLPPLTQSEATELLRRRVPSDVASDQLLEEVAAAGEGNPRRLVSVLRSAVVHAVSPSALAAMRRERERRLGQLGRASQMLVSELESRGPTSASDEELLKRMGWTRARASQVFKSLEEAGIVVSSFRRDGPGRPKKVYELAEPLGEP